MNRMQELLLIDRKKQKENTDFERETLIKKIRVDGERDFKAKTALKDSVLLIEDLLASIERGGWSSRKDTRALISLSPALLNYLDSKDEILIRATVDFLKYLVGKMNKRITNLFDRIIATVLTTRFN